MRTDQGKTKDNGCTGNLVLLLIHCWFLKLVLFQVALKRQQAAEDAIALHLASAESGTTYEYLPPGRIFGMQVTSPEPDSSSKEPETSDPTPEEILVSPASIEMLAKLFPNKKRAVLELVLKRCNHDLLKAIEHFNINNNKHESEPDSHSCNPETSSAFKPVSNNRTSKPYVVPHSGSFSFIPSNKAFSLYPFWPLFNPQFNPQPILPSPVLVQGFCECDQCKPDGPWASKGESYGREATRPS